MRVSYEWLGTMVKLPSDVNELVREYTRTGTEVEAVETLGSALDHVVTSQVLTKVAHPDSDHMWVTTVDVGKYNVDENGDPTPLQVVCGAQNFEVGDHIVTALEGAVLPGDFKIKKSKKRGVVSYGMNCSAKELGLGAEADGILILPKDAPIGMPVSQYLNTADTVVDCEITPNRPDCLSMIGMARETSAVLDEDMHVDLPTIVHETGTPTADVVDVAIDDDELCQRYVARVVRNVKIGPSPEWLARRVVAAGSRPINNVVDVTNYVMYLTGQPLHAFDLGKLSRDEQGKAHIVVRAARDGEHITTLDGQDRTLTHDMAVITDAGEKPVALAGVMGGENSDIDDTTVDVLLESAAFSSGHISRTSRNLQLISEASMRYERIVDAQNCANVADIAAALFESVCSAEVAPGKVDVYPVKTEQPHLRLRCERLRAFMGAPIEDEFARHSLERLGCTVTPTDQEHVFDVVPPSWRPDLPREIDLYEEIARLWGEGDVEATLPAPRNHRGGLTVEQHRQRKVGTILRACGLNETVNYNFVAEDDLERVRMTSEGRGEKVRLMSPMSADFAVMRQTLIPGLLRNIAYNHAHGVSDVALYEIGRVYFGRPGKAQPKERTYVAGVLSGKWRQDGWNVRDGQLDFFDAKGVVETLLDAMRVTKVRYRAVEDPQSMGFAQPGRVCEVLASGAVLGWIAELHPAMLRDFDVDGAVAAFELDLEQLISISHAELPYQDVPQLPAVSMDLALVVDESVTCERLMQVISSAGGKHLSSVHLFDVYRDPIHVGPGKKSMAFALQYRSEDHTLTSQEAEALHEKLVSKVCKATGAKVRGE